MLDHAHALRYELIEFAFLTLAARCRHLVPLHAACVGLRGRGLLLNGQSGAGKSTTSLACALQGFELLSDDAVFVSPESLLATGCPNFVHVHADSTHFSTTADLAALLERSATIERRSGARKLEIDARNPRFILPANPLRLQALILLSTETGRGAGLLDAVDPREALRELAADQPYAAGRPEWVTFERALATIPAWRLRRSRQPADAAAGLLEFAAGLSQ